MNGFVFQSLQWLWLLLLVPTSVLLMLYQQKQSIKDLQAYRDQPINKTFRWRHTLFHFCAITALVLALARPGWNPVPEGVNETGRDTIFLLDVSRSMLARDVRPDRISAAKNAMRRLINRNAGDRFGLVVFAGSPLIASPLTNDRFFLNNLLDNIDTDSVTQGGTLINEALMEVLDKMINEESGASTDLVLISDGEDLGGDTDHALVLLNLLGTRLLVVGLGDNQNGARVPARSGDGWTLIDGNEHWSKRNDATLRVLAQGVDQGVYFPVGTDYLDLNAIMKKLQAMWPGQQRNESKVMKYTEGYPWLLGLAALLQLLLLLRIQQRVLAAGLMVLSFNAQSVSDYDGLDIPTLEAKAISFSESQEYQETVQIYRRIWTLADTEAVAISASFNLATSLVLHAMQKPDKALSRDAKQRLAKKKQRQLAEARKLYRGVLMVAPEHHGSARNLELLTMISEQQRSKKGNSGKNGQQGQNGQEGQTGQAGDSQGQSDSNSQSSSSSSGPSFSDLVLPSPSESAKDIMEQSRKGSKSRAGWRKQSPVERDW